MEEGIKKCSRCREEKPTTEFWNDKNRLSGKFSWCKACCKPYYKNQEIWKRVWVPPKRANKKSHERVSHRGRKAAYPFFLKTRFNFDIPQKWTLTYRYSTVFGLSAKAEELKVRLAHELEKKMKGKKIRNNKLWVIMTICKPRIGQRNEYYMQLISQVVQHVTKLPSTWYCYQTDWIIDKKRPGVVLSLIQVENVDRQICGYCGEMLLTKYLVTNSTQKLGVTYACKWCESIRLQAVGKAYRERTKSVLAYTRSRKKGIASST